MALMSVRKCGREQDTLECCALPAIRGRMAFKVNDEDRRFQRIRKWSNL